MDELKPQRRPFQFSLRKLLLWTAVWSAWLGFVRWSMIQLPIAVGLTIYLATILVVRVRWGYERSSRIAVPAAGVVAFCIAVPLLIPPWTNPAPSADKILILILFITMMSCAIGTFVGLSSFLLVHAVVCAVDWLDNLMATKPPQDPG